MAHKIKGVREKLDDIAALNDEFGLAERPEDEKTTMNRRDMTHSFVNPSNVIGRGDDKQKIMDLLMQQDASRNVSVIPIVGIGGMEGRLTNLRTLIVGECPSLTSLTLSIKHLTALEYLMIGDCEELSLTDKEENPDLQLSLRLLIIRKLPKLEVFPQWLQASANTLQHLGIVDCCNFTALPEWLPNLKSLQTIRIKECPMFSSLPEGMQDLTALREFQIEDCPKLSGNCREEVRHKIAHVPNIDFDDNFDEDSGSSSKGDDDINEYLQGEDDEELNTSHNQ
ncbi:hypothetical protein CMV_011070 [Castanea mollissima]|uniref:Uncharacterized protein n=1 Tax=Castanea mollissima TaxID=60419 RepID=A0A8J4W0A7_9ROSI|nr:hypothetical protein CMV_011070 [Castanea mollissima]